MKQIALFIFVLMGGVLTAQNAIQGTVKDAVTGETLQGATVSLKGTALGSITDANGAFRIMARTQPPYTLVVTYVGFKTDEVTVSGNDAGAIQLNPATLLGDEVIVSASRFAESTLKTPVTVEKITARAISESPAASFWDALNNMKGVDLGTQSLGFKSVNMRGFGANNNSRVVQLIDGMDTRSVGWGFTFGNIAGISDLDVDNVELIPGAASVLYGPDALNGIMLTTTKSPFEYQGLSVQFKNGINHVGSSTYDSPKWIGDYAIRYAKAYGNFAFKINAAMFRGTDWASDDMSDRLARQRPNSGPGGINYRPNDDRNANQLYDGVNIYGDEFNGNAVAMPAGSGLAGRSVTRTGYREVDLLDNSIYSNKVSGEVRYKITPSIEAIASVMWGQGNTIQTPGDRNYYPTFNRTQSKLELRSSDFFVRGYATLQTSEEAYGTVRLAGILNTFSKTNAAWGTDYANAFDGKVSGVSAASHAAARAYADRTRIQPGTARFTQIRDSLQALIVGTNTTGGGTGRAGIQIRDNSDLYHFEGMYNFSRLLNNAVEVLVGGNWRKYDLASNGTLFPVKVKGLTLEGDEEYGITEYGGYISAAKTINIGEKFSLRPSFAARYDKNEYFDGGITPRGSLVIGYGQHNLRGSYQTAFRNPTPNQLFANNFPGGEVGGSNIITDQLNLVNNPIYTDASVQTWRRTGNLADLVKVDPTRFTTEKIASWEVGYKGIIAEKLFVDVYYFNSTYSDFIAAQPVRQGKGTTGSIDSLRTNNSSNAFNYNFNRNVQQYVTGWGLSLEYNLAGYRIGGNIAQANGYSDVLINGQNERRLLSDTANTKIGRNFFNSPEWRGNLSVNKPNLTKNLGFGVTLRWQGEMWWEQFFGDAWMPAFTTVDAQVSYRLPKFKTVIKLGGSNLFNQYYRQGYALPAVGGLYYLSLNFDEMFR